MNIDIFTSNEWNHFHDTIFSATNTHYELATLKKIFKSLPENLKDDAAEFGMNDTVFRDNLHDYFRDKIKTTYKEC